METLFTIKKNADLAELKKRMLDDNIRYQSVRDQADRGFVIMLRDDTVPLLKIQGISKIINLIQNYCW